MSSLPISIAAVCSGCTRIDCAACRRSHVLAEARRLAIDARALREGRAPFHELSEAERFEQLAALLPDEALILLVSDERTEAAWLAAAALELAERLGVSDEPCGGPTPAERQEIESICEQIDADRWDGLG